MYIGVWADGGEGGKGAGGRRRGVEGDGVVPERGSPPSAVVGRAQVSVSPRFWVRTRSSPKHIRTFLDLPLALRMKPSP